MVRFARIWAAAALLALLGAPVFACFVPRQLLNAAESDCCRQMGGQCGSKTMPSSHSCCKTPSEHAQPYIGAVDHTRFSPSIAVAFVAMRVLAFSSVAHGIPRLKEWHSPALGPPETTSVLRI